MYTSYLAFESSVPRSGFDRSQDRERRTHGLRSCTQKRIAFANGRLLGTKYSSVFVSLRSGITDARSCCAWLRFVCPACARIVSLTTNRSTSNLWSIKFDCQLVCFYSLTHFHSFAGAFSNKLNVSTQLISILLHTFSCSALFIMRTSSALLCVAAALQHVAAVPQRSGGDQSHPLNFEGPYGIGNDYCNLCPVSYCFTDRNVSLTYSG